MLRAARAPQDGRRASDRRLALAIAWAAVIGIVCLAFGVWGLLHPPRPGQPHWFGTAGIDGVVAGLIFLGFAAGELMHRIRRGPQAPGRHSRR